MDVNLDDVQNVLTMSTDDDMVEAKTFKTQNSCHRDKLIYGVTDAPPIYVTLLCGLQVCAALCFHCLSAYMWT